MATYIHKESGTKFHAHASLLCHYSPFFKKALTGRFQESESRIIEIYDVELWVLEVFQNWLYFRNCDWIPSPGFDAGGDSRDYTALEHVQMISFADKYSVPELFEVEAQRLGKCLNDGTGMKSDALLFAQDHLPESSPVMVMIAEAIARFGIKDGGEGTALMGLKPALEKLIARSIIQSRDRQKKRNDNVAPGKKMNVTKLLRTSNNATNEKAQDDEMSIDGNDDATDNESDDE